MEPNFYYEKRLWKQGFKFIAGVDEVGRGCFAGPVVASTVVLAPNSNFQFPITNENEEKIFINDSKRLTEKQRLISDKWIRENAETWGIGEANVAEINKLGMTKATQVAFRRAVVEANEKVSCEIDHLLIDAFYIPRVRGFPVGSANLQGRQQAIVKGDSKSISIAAASIVAKVYRDELMRNLGTRKIYAMYDWKNNKGYGTAAHCKAIEKHGPCKYHREQFIRNYV